MAGAHMVPDAVHGHAAAAQAIGDTVAPLSTGFPATDHLTGAAAGWSAAAALQACLTTWSGRIRTQSQEIDGAAALLHRSASGYRATDQASATRIQAVGEEGARIPAGGQEGTTRLQAAGRDGATPIPAAGRITDGL